MHSFSDRDALTRPVPADLDTSLRTLLTDMIDHYAEAGLLDLTHILAIEPGDTEQQVVEAISLSPLVNPIDRVRYGHPGFMPYWDWLERHDGWFEMIITVGDSGFAFILLIKDDEGTDPCLRSLCRTFAGERDSSATLYDVGCLAS